MTGFWAQKSSDNTG